MKRLEILSLLGLLTFCTLNSINVKPQEVVAAEVSAPSELVSEETNILTIVKETDDVVENIVDSSQEAIYAMFYSELDKVNSIDDKKEWFLAYKILTEKWSWLIDPPESIYNYFEQSDIELMASVVERECYTADFESKTHVASVIINRVYDERFPSDLHKVLTAKGQFGNPRRNFSDDTILACEYAFFLDTAQGCVYFHSMDERAKFNGASFVFEDDISHKFYK